VLPHLLKPGTADDIARWLKGLSRAQRLRILEQAIAQVTTTIEHNTRRCSMGRTAGSPEAARDKRRLRSWQAWRQQLLGAISESRRSRGRGRPSALTPFFSGASPDLATADARERFLIQLYMRLRPSATGRSRITIRRVAAALHGMGIQVSPRSLNRILRSTFDVSILELKRSFAQWAQDQDTKDPLARIAEITRLTTSRSDHHVF
jgi:hypothetical protein